MGRRPQLVGVLLLGCLASCTALLGDDFEIAAGGQGGTGGQTTGGGGTGGAGADCGNGELDGSETCDDGNDVAGDGCDPGCQVEGSCAEPLALPETVHEPNLIQWAIEASTGGVSQLDVAACDGQARGAGSDRIYSFTLTDTRDVRISIEATFTPAVRLLAEPCTLDAEVLEPGQPDGCTTGDPLLFRGLAPSAYFVAVDGADSADAGTFSLTVDAACPKGALHLAELRIGTPEGVLLENMASSCAVDLNDLFVRFDDTSYPSITVDLSERLQQPNAPEPLLPAGEAIWLADEPVPGGILIADNVPFSPNRGGSVLLCRGPCTDTAAGLLDLVAFSEGDAHPALPAGVTFSPSGLSGIAYIDDANHTSYQRVGLDGTTPGFLASDWRVWFFPPTLFYDSFEDGSFDDWTAQPSGGTYDISVVSTHGNRSLHIDGDTGEYGGMYYTLPPIQPSRVQFAVRGTPGATHAVGWFMIGADDLTAEDGMVQFRIANNDRLIFTVQGASLIFSNYTTLNWNLIAYENINWQAKTFDLAINGQVVEQGRGFWQQNLPHITRIHLYNTSPNANAMAMYDWILMTE